MTQRTASRVTDEPYHRTAVLIARWFREHEPVLRGAVALRALGGAGVEASAASLAVPVVRRFALSVALFDAMVRSDGTDPAVLLARVLDDEAVELVMAIGDDVVVGDRLLHLVPIDGTRRG